MLIKSKLKILVLDSDSNKDILNIINELKKYEVYGMTKENMFYIIKNINIYDVIVVGILERIDISMAFNIIDLFIDGGKEVLCVKFFNKIINKPKQTYLLNYLILNGCIYVQLY